MYNDKYATIDANQTDSKVGLRRNRNVRDNIYVINAITNNIRKNCLKTQIYKSMMLKSALTSAIMTVTTVPTVTTVYSICCHYCHNCLLSLLSLRSQLSLLSLLSLLSHKLEDR